MEQKTLLAKDLLKTSGIIRCRPEETLSQALTKLSRSHDAVFVFGEKAKPRTAPMTIGTGTGDKFLGVINPYYAIFKSNFPADTKVKNCLFNPPHLTPETYIWDIAKLMVESKIYFLPVFGDNGNFVGIVSVNRVFQAVRDNKNLANRLQVQTKKEVVTVNCDASLLETFNLMRDKQVTRLPVVDSHEHLLGIVARYDIRVALAEPKRKPRWLSRTGEKEIFLDHPLEGYYKKIVVVASPTTLAREILAKMLDKEVGSVVIVEGNGRPIGIVSSHDILKAIDRLRPPRAKDIDLKLEEGFTQRARVEEMLLRFVSKIDKFNPVRKVQFVLEAEKNPAGRVRRYTTQLQLMLKDGGRVIGKAVDFDWKKAVRQTLEKVRRQLFS